MVNKDVISKYHKQEREPPFPPPAPPLVPGRGWAIASFVLGAISLLNSGLIYSQPVDGLVEVFLVVPFFLATAIPGGGMLTGAIAVYKLFQAKASPWMRRFALLALGLCVLSMVLHVYLFSPPYEQMRCPEGLFHC